MFCKKLSNIDIFYDLFERWARLLVAVIHLVKSKLLDFPNARRLRFMVVIDYL